MTTPANVVAFREADLSPVVVVMDSLAASGDAGGWVNIRPELTEEDSARVPARSGLAAWFSARGPAVPMGTWMPAVRRGRTRPAQVGLEHGTGPDALTRLSEVGVGLPSGWAKRQDHAKHGIVADLPDPVDHAAVVEWVVRAASALSPTVALGPGWVAVVHYSR